MNRELEIRERVALYGLELTGHDREALDIARGNLEFYAYSDLRYLLSETARLRADLAAMTAERDKWQRMAEAAERDFHDYVHYGHERCAYCIHDDECEPGESLCYANQIAWDWRGPREDEPNDTKEANHADE